MAERPNILFVIADDLNTAVSGYGTIPFAPTPNLDRLRERGVTFLNAQNNCSVCVPSRNSLLTGLYPHTTGNMQLVEKVRELPLLWDAVTMPACFRWHGYGAYGAGKVFHNGPADSRDQACWDEYGNTTDYGPLPWYPEKNDGKGGAGPHPLQAWLLEAEEIFGQRKELQDPWFCPGGRSRFPFEHSFGPLSRVPEGGWRYRNGMPFRYEGEDDRDRMPDEMTADFGIEVLERDHEKPFFLALGLVRPHTPLYVPDPWFDAFPPESIELPKVLENDLDDCAQSLVAHRPYARFRWEMIRQGGEKRWREWLQAYLASVAFADAQLGRILDALAASPYANNTIVVFTSDNGYHMGQKECLFKYTLWEESGRIPLVVAAPGVAQAGGTCDHPVSLVDLYPTLLDLAGLDMAPHSRSHGQPLDGCSLRSLLENPDSGAWNGPPVALTSVRGVTGVHHSVRSRTHRYTLCENGEEELYNHEADPHEWWNLAGRREHEEVKRALRTELEKLLGR